ncbi:glutamate synthase [Halovivax asiaticus JCM 14624]|uniref:Glutamate synthase n=1 Tax=Halovivax asiaticus JCM 14624 TaxID=1227490 RepID=M0BV93_9EURY|nr:glutamate synthase large subunit [Halovivax asiaticus]ELZ14333.1 glutamate synthase [Halovivax asiaticus JCM 14624]
MSRSDAPSAASHVDGLAPGDHRSNCGVGIVADIESGGGHRTVADALSLLRNLEHRGTTGAEPNTGDGAGILLQTPDRFFREVLDVPLPETYAAGSLFLPRAEVARETVVDAVESVLARYDLDVLTWRAVPTDNAGLGETALESEPAVSQCFVAPADHADAIPSDDFDRRLYVARRALESTLAELDDPEPDHVYVCSLDRETIVYKGLLTGTQLASYYPDLSDERVESTFAMVHERFSTNTLGAWHLAHPFRRTIHNGEFNTLRGNVNWMRARESELDSETIPDLDAIRPIVDDDGRSDTAVFDTVLELLLADGRSLPHCLRLLIPEAWRTDETMAADRRDWYDFHASLVEPWDGPALVAATDGSRVGAVLDRNGLRPCRYEVTTDGRVVMASETGALELEPSTIADRGRLEPGELLLIDPAAGEVRADDDVFDELVDDRYGEWIDSEQVHLDHVRENSAVSAPATDGETPRLRATQAAFGYTHDELESLLEPMAASGEDPVGSMGDDTPLSVLASVNRPLFSYFRQLFAQVTNPPIDYVREALVTSLECRLGRQRNLLDESSAHAHQLVLDSPILTENDLAAVREGERNGITATTVDTTFAVERDGGSDESAEDAGEALEAALERVRADAAAAVADGHELVILSDATIGPDRAAIPSLLATSAVHQHLVREGLRARAGLVVESGDPRTVHQVATLIGYGAGAVCPTLAFDTIRNLTAGPDGADEADAIDAYVGALEGGLSKTMAKMGISTVESYRGAQIFEAVGLDDELVERYFTGTETTIGGIGLAELEADLLARHRNGFDESEAALDRTGEFANRRDGVHHQWNPQTVGALQDAVRSGDYDRYLEFAELINDQSERLQTLRGLLEFDSDRDPIPIEDVEPVAEIVTRFSTAAMSLGSLSPEAHENNAIATNRIGAKANTGEGGEPPERFGTERECSVKQVASARFGVTSTYLAAADELQIKMAQGSKPGEGGHLPGSKVGEEIARIRKSTPGVGLISPPPLHDIYSIEDLKQLIYDLKAANEGADVNVKLVSEAGIGTIAAGVAKAKADAVHISGHSGGTGASPRTSIKHAGRPWELGLAEANQLLCETGLRDRIRLSVDGGLKTGRDVAVAALLGAEEYVFGTASLVSEGCVMARQCHENTCPVGIATQRGDLRERFPGEPAHVSNYLTSVADELREYMAELGFETVEEMIARVGALRQRSTRGTAASTDDAAGAPLPPVDLSAMLAEPAGSARTKGREQDHGLDDHVDRELIERAEPALADGESISLSTGVENVDRAVGTMLSNRVASRYGEAGLPDETISVSLDGTAGQSFGAFLASGVSLHLTGVANDYVGKGLSGGIVTVDGPNGVRYDPAETVSIGNVALYGATDGECYVEGVAGERFAVRNSGAKAVVEGVGDHGCEYMTGGVVAVLGDIGRNFAAGMSGGVAYIHDPDGDRRESISSDSVQGTDELSDRDEAILRRLLENHVAYTDSKRAAALLADWDCAADEFVAVIPEAYRRAIESDGRTDVRNELPSRPASSEVHSIPGRISSDD